MDVDHRGGYIEISEQFLQSLQMPESRHTTARVPLSYANMSNVLIPGSFSTSYLFAITVSPQRRQAKPGAVLIHLHLLAGMANLTRSTRPITHTGFFPDVHGR